MATAAEIAALRLIIAEPDDEAPYTDAILSVRLDGAASSQALASQIWLEKAATYAELVNTSESGSSRNLSDLHKNALAMAATFKAQDPAAPDLAESRGVRMSRLTR